jgi:type I restriction enzyme R subunit
MAGLSYFRILQNKIAEKHNANPEQYNYKILYAFSDFIHRITNEEIREHKLNGLETSEKIEDRFARNDYRIMIVASKFQTGFNEPLLAGMFLDKPVLDKNAVQTLSRLNRCYEGKQKVVVVDFTNNTDNIIKAFNKYRQGTPYEASEPNKEKVDKIYQDIIDRGLFTDTDAADFFALLKDADTQTMASRYRVRLVFFYETLADQKDYVYQLAKLVKAYNFLSSFYKYSKQIVQFVFFAESIGSQLIKEGSESELMNDISKVLLSKAAVNFLDTIDFTPERIKKLSGRGGNTTPMPPPRTSIGLAIEAIKARYPISDEEALIIREVCEEKQADREILSTINLYKDWQNDLENTVKSQIKASIKQAYEQRKHYRELYEDKYIDDGAIFDMMTNTVLTHGLETARGSESVG